MWIVRLALQRPYTFVVMAMLIVLAGIFTISRMPTDVFPEVDIPVIAVVWAYGGLAPEEMDLRFTGNYERALTTTVSGIEHIESQALYGISVTKIFFHQGTRIEGANAQVTAISQTLLKSFPPGSTPPLILNYSASNVPILQGSVHSDTLAEQTLFDLTTNSLRTGLATVQGAQMPFPNGGKVRQIMIDIDPARLQAMQLSPRDVSDAISLQNLILPSGTVKLGDQELMLRLNSSADTMAELAAMPLRSLNGSTVTIGDVAQVRDGFAVQTSVVHADGRRGVLMPILKSAGQSTLDIVARVRDVIPASLASLPPAYKLDLLFDQSIFVRAAVEGVIKEAVIAAFLTGLMILLFLGSWRSTVVVVVSIPLSILVSIIVLAVLGQTLNLMTLGGMSLAVGILVDDATVEIENVHRNLGMRKPLVQAILDGAAQIATPAFVATLCICIVFIPVTFITGAAKSLFTPLAMAVVFAMLTSYFLSRTLVPTMVNYLLSAELGRYTGEDHGEGDPIWQVHQRFNVQFERLRRAYGGWLDYALDNGKAVVIGFLVVCGLSVAVLVPNLGQDFFPGVDAGQIRFHVRAPPGTRLEETEHIFAQVEEEVRDIIDSKDLVTIIDNIGIPNSGINLALGDPSMVSAADGEVLVQLSEDHEVSTFDYISRLRERYKKRFPALDVFFLAPDITTQVLNFGLSAPIDIQIAGPLGNQDKNLEIARQLRKDLAAVPGAVDVHIAQVVGSPELRVNVDRVEASQQGLSQRDVASDMLVSLSSSGQVSPNFWLDPKRGVQYLVAVQTPQYKMSTINSISETPIDFHKGSEPQTLGNLATLKRGGARVNITHYNVANTFDVQANVQGSDLGSVAKQVHRLVDTLKPNLPRGSSILVRGQVQSMESSFAGLEVGIVFAVVLVYFLMVVNFQSWLDPMIILTALPGCLTGICWMLFVSHTTLSVPALMGAIMSIGVATSNAILMVTFANDQRPLGDDARTAAFKAGITRLRPIMMTALAMIIGMLPMSLGLGEGGEQNAPLGRAVIGGLCLATFATLFFVPVVYAAWRKAAPKLDASEVS